MNSFLAGAITGLIAGGFGAYFGHRRYLRYWGRIERIARAKVRGQ